jgi:hypothetical protein
MHPVWVIRASRTAFALRPNRVSTSNICHKRPLSTVIFQPLFHPLLSILIPFIHNHRLRPAAGPSATDPTLLYEAFFTDLAARLEESAHLATVLRLSLRRSSLSNSFRLATPAFTHTEVHQFTHFWISTRIATQRGRIYSQNASPTPSV